MNKKRQKIIIVANITFLLIILIIQINWIFTAARQQEDIFNRNVEMALAKTMEEIKGNMDICSHLNNDVNKSVGCLNNVIMIKGDNKEVIDSILQINLEYYNVTIDYSYEIVNSPIRACGKESHCYSKCLSKTSNESGVQLKINFPGKTEFILSQISFLFVISILLIILVSISFIFTLKNYSRVEKLSMNTRNFIDNMVHEFKTPITNVKLANSMIRKSCADENDKIVQLTKVVQEENERLEMQVERVLLMSTFDNNQQQNIQKEDIHDILQKTMESFKLQISEKNGTIGFDLNANDFNIRCNRESLSRAFSNIIDNAVKYSKGNPEINILTYNKKNSLYIEFSDKGCGIKKEHLPNIFDKYFRVPTGNIHNVKGFGLGLAYVKNVIKSCGGNITVASKFGEGTVFTIEIPIEIIK